MAPDQNFTYMIAVQPKLAFIVDIRRGNFLQHLMYKAIFELSTDRADFLSRLFSKARPAGVGPKANVAELFSAFNRVDMPVEQYKAKYQQNLQAIRDLLLKKHRFRACRRRTSSSSSRSTSRFSGKGPAFGYSMSPTGLMGSRFGTNFPTYEEMMMQTDWDGVARSYLASEENFRFIKGLQERNLIVPIVGNFAGPKALRAVGRYVRERGSDHRGLLRFQRRAVPVHGSAVRRLRTQRRDASDRRRQRLHPVGLEPIRLLGPVSLDRRPRQRSGSDAALRARLPGRTDSDLLRCECKIPIKVLDGVARLGLSTANARRSAAGAVNREDGVARLGLSTAKTA